MTGWIKLHRKLRDWQWYDDHNATRLLIHLLISVNYEDKKWKGILIKSGSLVTSWEHLSKDCGLSLRQTRTSMSKLENSGEVTRKVTNKYQLITLIKWEELQSNDSQVTLELTDKRQSNDKPSTTTKEVKEVKEEKILFNFRKALVDYGFREDLVIDWLKVRKDKKASNTKTALNSFLKEIEKRNCDINQILELIVIKSWKGFKWAWYDTEIEKEKNISTSTKEEKEKSFKSSVKSTDIYKSGKYPVEMFVHFTEYWMAETKSKKLLFETKEAFSFEASLKTWINNDQKYRDL